MLWQPPAIPTEEWHTTLEAGTGGKNKDGTGTGRRRFVPLFWQLLQNRRCDNSSCMQCQWCHNTATGTVEEWLLHTLYQATTSRACHNCSLACSSVTLNSCPSCVSCHAFVWDCSSLFAVLKKKNSCLPVRGRYQEGECQGWGFWGVGKNLGATPQIRTTASTKRGRQSS